VFRARRVGFSGVFSLVKGLKQIDPGPLVVQFALWVFQKPLLWVFQKPLIGPALRVFSGLVLLPDLGFSNTIGMSVLVGSRNSVHIRCESLMAVLILLIVLTKRVHFTSLCPVFWAVKARLSQLRQGVCSTIRQGPE
jgi:hypothetical protein